ncbi:hypothetical protein M011DRAFT_397689 [Sporormia fimetaria CBS 119925]|uniref:Large ribosomal subunit protein mL59 domain-containing protein n=1 Tax=Sporormia fimetaria CBS 119925 TaxID=1340428 RepID=A0A6A6VH84_9PLEO|nr:hypothetical protein M011DRAFT_397689 [Sporormia fimetaria CBS 119925]
MSVQKHIELGKSLHPRLIQFFKRYPPPALFSTPPTAPQTPATANPPTPIEANAPPAVEPIATENGDSVAELGYHNPFQPRKNHRTGKWLGPVYGLRKQAELVKLAEKYGVVDLLPYTVKKPEEKEKRRIEGGLRVRGTGVGMKVKGKIWERTLNARLEQRRRAMEYMPVLIERWKATGHGRGWNQWPSGRKGKK